MRKKDNPNQLWLNFDQAVTEFQTASSNLAAAAKALVEAQPSAKPAVDKTLKAERAKVVAMIKVHARHKRIHWQHMWHIAYEELRKRTGFDAPVKALQWGGSQLDAVVRAGKLPKLISIVGGL